MSKAVIVEEKEEGILCITLNRPEALNALMGDLVGEFVDAIQTADHDTRYKVAIITGNGRAFCAGGDVKAMHEESGMFAGTPLEVAGRYHRELHCIPTTMQKLEIPMIAAVNGFAVGAGNDLAAMCDVRLAADTAVFSGAFARLGLLPGDGGAWFLPRLMGYSNAFEMLLTADNYSAQDMKDRGFVSKIVPGESLMEEAMSLARRMARHSSEVLRNTKRLLKESEQVTLSQALLTVSGLQACCHRSEAHKNAVAALVAKG